MWGREKISKSLSTGVVVLVFLLLIVQLAIFGAKIFQLYQQRKEVAGSVEESAAPAKSLSGPSGNSTSASGNQPACGNSSSGGDSIAAGKTKESQETAPKATKRKFALAPLPPKPAYTPKPKVDINTADTTQLMTLYGIGSYYARSIVSFRERLGGSFASVEQLMDIKGIDSARFVGFESRICLDTNLIRKIDFYTYPIDSLNIHPYIGKYAAKGIDRLRRTVGREEFSIGMLVENEIVSEAHAQRLSLYVK